MRQTQLFTKTRFEAPSDEVSKNASLLIRAGFIHKEMAGVYVFLPLGLRVLKNVERIVKEEMNKVGGQEMLLTALQSKELWEKTNRWSDEVVDNWFKTKLKNDTEVGLGFTHEEPLTNLMKEYVRSYKDLPVCAYQFQTKFRNESRAKSGILRGREFLMKDMYTFCKDDKEHEEFYERIKQAYLNIYKKVGIGDKTYVTFASGGVFAEFSHEFQTETESGEDIIYIDEESKVAVNKEVYNEIVLNKLGLDPEKLVEKKAIEVGNIFTLGTRFSDALELLYTDESGEKRAVKMGSYGIGISRLMGTIVEVLGSENGIVWPEEVSPFKVHLIDLSQGDEEIKNKVNEFYKALKDNNIDVLLDDRDARAGEKFADADLIGIPHRIVISKKTEEAGMVEYKNRITNETLQKTKQEVLDLLK